MKRTGWLLGIIVVAFGIGVAAQMRAEVALKAAIELETVKGDLTGAINAYKRIADDPSADRATRARALVQLAGCYRKQGDAEAGRVYERIVREFADQREAVNAARAALASPRNDGAPSLRHVWTLPPETIPLGKVSADGRFVAYNDSDGLTVRDLRDGSTRLVTKERALGACLAPDGSQIAYTTTSGPRPIRNSSASVSLHVASLSPAGPVAIRKVWEGEMSLWPIEWADSRRILVAMALRNVPRPGRIGFIAVADGAVDIVEPDLPDVPEEMALSPDGRYIAYDLYADDQPDGALDLFVLSLAGRTTARVVNHRADDQLVGWTPSGDGVVFTSDRGGDDGLWLLPIADGKARSAPQLLRRYADAFWFGGITRTGAFHYTPFLPLARTEVRAGVFDGSSGRWVEPPQELRHEGASGPATRPDWSPNGRVLAYAVDLGRGISDRETRIVFRSVERDTIEREVAMPVGIQSMRWSPDGSGVVVLGLRRNNTRGMWRVDYATGALSEVPMPALPASTSESFAAWSRDGRHAYVHRHRLVEDAMMLLERDWRTGVEREIFRADNNAGWPLPSPDGTTLYYSRFEAGAGVYRQSTLIERDLATGRERELSTGRNHGGVNLSPDGRFIVTGSNDPATKTRAMLAIPVAGGPVRELMKVPLSEAYVSGSSRANPIGLHTWLPDSSGVILVNEVTGDLWWVRLDSGASVKLDPNQVGVVSGRFAFHPDGRRVAFPSRSGAPRKAFELWVMEGFLPDSRK